MYRRPRTVLTFSWSIALLVCVVCTVLVTHNLSATADQTSAQTRPAGKGRNLSLQPEAFKLSRRLGKRFLTSNLSSTTIVGILTTDGTEKNINITRQQTPTGEDVGIGIAGETGTLTWNDGEDDKPSVTSSGEAQQILIERVVLDTPDQFILAQLRGANYYTVAHNVRADTGGSDNYTGPLWDVVRVDEPQSVRAQRLLSNSRLYYINVQTGLIDKIVSDFKGETIEANILAWSDQSGEKFPTHVIWKRGNETVLEFRLTSVSIQTQL
jgi:hypothetical protein